MRSVFLSYRRDDSPGYAGRVFDRLAGHFGAAKVFRDVDSIGYGEDFIERINVTVGSCDALIAIIGKQWLEARDKAGRRRLDDPKDFVRLEIKAALDRRIPVIPVLVADASMPPEEELPADLAPLGRRQALEISDKRFDYDVDELIRALEGGKRGRSSEGGKKRRTKALAGIVAAAGAVAACFFGYRYVVSEPGQPITKEKAVVQAERPVIREFVAMPPVVTPGRAVRLRWRVENGQRAEIERLAMQLTLPSGEWEHRPSQSQTYTLVVYGEGGVVERSSASVRVEASPPADAVIEEFAAKPATVKAGEAVTLTWKVRNASRVELRPVMAGLAPKQGTTEDRPDSNRTYTLTATAAGGKVVSESVSVVVTARPVQPPPGQNSNIGNSPPGNSPPLASPKMVSKVPVFTSVTPNLPAPTKVLLTLARVYVKEDGSPGATDWHFDILIFGKRMMALSRRSYDDKSPDARSGVTPLGIDRVEIPLEIPPGGKITVQINGYHSYGNKLSATGAYGFDPRLKGVRMEVKNQQNPKDGWFLFEFRVTPQ